MTYHKTSALKVHNKFAPVAGRRSAVMVDQQFDVPEIRSTDLNIGSYDAGCFTLIYAIFVANRDRHFQYDGNQEDLNVMQFQTSEFNIVFMWSFLSIIAYDVAYRLGMASFHDINENGRKVYVPTEGLDESECIEQFRIQRLMSGLDLTLALKNDPRVAPSYGVKAIRNARFYKLGRGPVDLRYLRSGKYKLNADNSLMTP